MKAKDLLSQITEDDRHSDNGLRHSFISLIFSAINDSAELNDSQQSMVRGWIIDEYQRVKRNSTEIFEERRPVMTIATFINTCRV